jgi:DNA-directed RNA polymerase specialized sigma24 family protein
MGKVMSTAPPDGLVTFLLERLEKGDPEAAKRLWEAYFARLVSLARARLWASPRGMADEEDVALSAFNSFFDGVKAGRFPRLDNRDDLWQILLVLTTRKAVGLIRHQTMLKRWLRGVISIPGGSGVDGPAIASIQPTPEAVAEVMEQCGRLLGLLDTGRLREVAVWKMEGYTNVEIGEKLNRSVPTVERKLAAIRKIWKREADL